ncbi:hypothetical protein BD309DRAFT_972648 [Dichomitus squalens]|uniref:Uncharacterized protein n=1 Tax=Dichomitus squalens TaxID=114155 RepID=A0A4Q9NCT7_9APHY|nr:hypothetical protein BD309DRAFT_972648 [Dichomitus squalens]TBU51285.1 hypothetical protein BD310DRAFT_942422 [Dichomitus squalens]
MESTEHAVIILRDSNARRASYREQSLRALPRLRDHSPRLGPWTDGGSVRLRAFERDGAWRETTYVCVDEKKICRSVGALVFLIPMGSGHLALDGRGGEYSSDALG